MGQRYIWPKFVNNKQHNNIASNTIKNCLELGAAEFIISSGARNAEIIHAILSCGNLKYYSHPDERAAAFFTLGRSLATQRPVVMITTSGTAVAELLPACIEAYYQSVPLIFVTADRPDEFRYKGSPQTINQVNIFGMYAHADPENWKYDKPLHINVPIVEPQSNSFVSSDISVTIKDFKSTICSSESTLISNTNKLNDFLDTEDQINVIIGSLQSKLRKPVFDFLDKTKLPVYAESTSGLREKLCSLNNNDISADRIIRIGGVPSCRYWRDLEKNNAVKVFSIAKNGLPGISRTSEVVTEVNWNLIDYHNDCTPKNRNDSNKEAIKIISNHPLSEVALINKLSKVIGNESIVFLGNSMPIREWQIAATFEDKKCDFFSNRGANGIDGNLSTFLGLSNNYKSAWGIFGDLTALCDLNSLWFIDQLQNRNIKIVVINNGGGEIFDHVKSLKPASEALKNTIKNTHDLNFKMWAKMWDINYLRVDNPNHFNDIDIGTSIIELFPNKDQSMRFWNSYNKL